MDILSGLFKQIHKIQIDDIFKQSLNVIQMQLLKPNNSKKSLEYKSSGTDHITVDQINDSVNVHVQHNMKLMDQISVDQVSSNTVEVEYVFYEKHKKNIEMNDSCIQIGANGKIIVRDLSKISEQKNKILYTTTHKPIKKKINESISFSGGGYNCVYHLGIVKYIFENSILFKDLKYLGASGGAGIASIALCYESESESTKLTIINDILRDIIGMRLMNLKLSEQVARYSSILERYIDEEKFNKYIKRKNRCYISITDVSDIIPKNIIMNNFETYEQYIESLRGSACIPLLLDDTIRTVDGKWCLDGGLSNNIPVINEHTLRISCLNYPLMKADIYPKIICELKYSFISPEEKYIMNMFNLGYNDMEQYMREYKEQKNKNNYIGQCVKCLTDDPSISPSISPSPSPSLSPSMLPIPSGPIFVS